MSTSFNSYPLLFLPYDSNSSSLLLTFSFKRCLITIPFFLPGVSIVTVILLLFIPGISTLPLSFKFLDMSLISIESALYPRGGQRKYKKEIQVKSFNPTLLPFFLWFDRDIAYKISFRKKVFKQNYATFSSSSSSCGSIQFKLCFLLSIPFANSISFLFHVTWSGHKFLSCSEPRLWDKKRP